MRRIISGADQSTKRRFSLVSEIVRARNKLVIECRRRALENRSKLSITRASERERVRERERAALTVMAN